MPLSDKQMKYLALAWQCFETEPKIDYEKFYQIAGLKSQASARELMRVTKNKLKEEYGALSGQLQSTNNSSPKVTKSSTPSSAGDKRGRKAAARTPAGSDEEGDDEEETPASKKVSKTAAKVVKSEPTPDDSENDGLI